MSSRTFAFGDIHGDSAGLDRVLAKLPPLTSADTLLFIGDYVDRGPDSKGVVERVWKLQHESPAKVIALRGNHEDMWAICWDEPHLGFLTPRQNGTGEMFRSYTGRAVLGEEEELSRSEMFELIQVRSWLPEVVPAWFKQLPLWHEDEHAIYVHAGLEGEGSEWKHPRDCRDKPLMWMREEDFFLNYRGKRVVFGHTIVAQLPHEGSGGDTSNVWVRGDLCGIDTGAGKGGFLSVLELPGMKIYESR